MIEKNYHLPNRNPQCPGIWEEAGAFKAGRPERRDAKPFTIVIRRAERDRLSAYGHALNNTLQDILCRFERCAAANVLWQPGTDHARDRPPRWWSSAADGAAGTRSARLGPRQVLERVWQGRPRAAASSSTS